jgi:glycerol-3-phosphate acyltransferase PlsY
MERIISVLIGYVFGLIQTGYIYGMLNKIDIRKHGSGNAGTTNALRTLGWKAGVITFIGDCIKCIPAVLLIRLLFVQRENVELLAIYGGLGAVLGHNFPFYLKFKGGKGIAASAGLILSIHPVMFLITAVVFVGIVLVTQYVSLGSLIIMVLFVIQVVLYGQSGAFQLTEMELYEYYGIVVLLMVLAFWQHRANIGRLLKGTENKTDFRKIGKKQ